jgi:hypothetical protein
MLLANRILACYGFRCQVAGVRKAAVTEKSGMDLNGVDCTSGSASESSHSLLISRSVPDS